MTIAGPVPQRAALAHPAAKLHVIVGQYKRVF
jgi:hypothetical protein